MKRRFFIQGTTLGSIGLGIGADLLAFPASLEYSTVAKWLRQLSWTLSVQRRTQARSAPESFNQITGTKNEYFANHGYHKMSDNCYFFGENEQYCFYPVVARDKSCGISDLLMPFFRMDQSDHWQPVQTLTGFQVEALMKVSHALRENSPATIQNWLFPVGKANTINNAGSFATREGTVSVVTTLKNGRAMTTCTVTNRSGKVFHETFCSSHSLVC